MPRSDRFQRLLERRTTLEKLAEARSTSFAAKAASTENYDYIVKSMQPIAHDYTQTTFDEGERVRSQLANGLDSRFSTTFDYQGSVTSDTHIRTYSDIDLLVMDGRFTSIDSGAPNPSPYQGSAIVDLTELRTASASVLKQRFPKVKVDDKPGKSIALSGGSLDRKIDVVVGNWWDTQAYEETQYKPNRGIAIIDTKVPEPRPQQTLPAQLPHRGTGPAYQRAAQSHPLPEVFEVRCGHRGQVFQLRHHRGGLEHAGQRPDG